MKKSVVIGIILLLLIVGGGLAYKFISDGNSLPGLNAGAIKPEAPSPQRLVFTGFAGYTLPTMDVKGVQVPILRIPLDIWGGYAPLFTANGGSKPNVDSLFYKNGKFLVELVSLPDAKAQQKGFVDGEFPLIWASMDSLPQLYDGLKADKRVIPQAVGLFDWSAGGDGVVVRESIKTPRDLVGKKILTSGNTPYNFMLLWLLAQTGLSPVDVKTVYLSDGDQALEAFKNDPSIDAWVSWEPYISNVLQSNSPDYVKGTRMLISSKDANQLIADVYITRRDFAQEQGPLLQAFVESMMEATDIFAKDPDPTLSAMAEFYKLKAGPSEAAQLMKSVHLANFPENRMFFDPDNPIGANKIFLMAQEYYRSLGSLPSDVSYDPDRVINAQFLNKAFEKKLFANQKNGMLSSFNKNAAFDIADLENQRIVLTNDVKLYFEAQRIDFDLTSNTPESLENVRLLKEVVNQMRILGTTAVKLIGHLDTTKLADFKAKGQQAFVEASSQAKLISKKRAEFVKKVLIEKYGIEPERIVTEGRGWDQPIEGADPAANRRVEIQFLSFE